MDSERCIYYLSFGLPPWGGCDLGLYGLTLQFPCVPTQVVESLGHVVAPGLTFWRNCQTVFFNAFKKLCMFNCVLGRGVGT